MAANKRLTQYLAGTCASLSFMFVGAALSWASPALPKLKNGEAGSLVTDEQLSWLVSMATIGALPGCYMSQVLCQKIGRKRTIFASAVPGAVGSCIILLTSSMELMYVARTLTGVSTGMIAVVTMIYITEIADKDIRGNLGMLVQVMNNLGGLLIYGIGPYVSYNMLNTILLTVPITYVACCLWIPESPYYYLMIGNVDDARDVFVNIKGVSDEKLIDEQLSEIRSHVRRSMEEKSTMTELFTRKQYRRPVWIIAGLKVLQYLTGIVAIQAYLQMIFQHSSSISGPRASILYGFVQLVAGVLATFLPTYFGKRILMLTSTAGVTIAMVTLGIYFYILDYSLYPSIISSVTFIPPTAVLAFNILYTVGIGNLPYVMQAELFPMNVKSVASSAATMFACFLSFLVAKSYQNVKDMFGLHTVFWIFAAVAALGVPFIYFLVPETKGKTLEEVQDCMKADGAEMQTLKSDTQVSNQDVA